MSAWNPANWFNGSLAQDDESAKISTPGYGKGPLAPPKAAPALAVEKQAVAPAAQGEVAKIKVALLLPLSGTNAPLGQAMLNAAQMAVFDVAPSNFELMPRDTSAQGGAAAAARDALSSGAQLVIGPLFAADIPAVKAVAEPAGVAVLSLSTDTSMKDYGLYVMGFAPAAQVVRVVDFAAHKGARRFAALVPATAYGNLVTQAFQNAVQGAGGTITTIESYNPALRGDSATHVRTLSMLKEQTDALLLPEGSGDLAMIASQLAAAGFDNHTIHLLGTGLWDDADLGKTQNFLIGGWFAAPDPAMRRRFVDAYKNTYGQEPARLATLAYDATALSAALAKRGARMFDEVTLTNPNGFAGLDGIFRLIQGGGVERGLAINEVAAEGVHIADPAPSTFASH